MDAITKSEALVVQVRYFAGARTAAGVPEETVRVTRPGNAHVSVADVLEAVLALHDDRLAKVVAACSYLLNGVAVRDPATEVPENAALDLLPPFAGG